MPLSSSSAKKAEAIRGCTYIRIPSSVRLIPLPASKGVWFSRPQNCHTRHSDATIGNRSAALFISYTSIFGLRMLDVDHRPFKWVASAREYRWPVHAPHRVLVRQTYLAINLTAPLYYISPLFFYDASNHSSRPYGIFTSSPVWCSGWGKYSVDDKPCRPKCVDVAHFCFSYEWNRYQKTIHHERTMPVSIQFKPLNSTSESFPRVEPTKFRSLSSWFPF